MILTVIVIAAAMFLFGFFLSSVKEAPTKNIKTAAKPDEDLLNISREYHNFLNYDGSQQE